jgi:hypothetical protein
VLLSIDSESPVRVDDPLRIDTAAPFFNAASLACGWLYALFAHRRKTVSTNAVVVWRTVMLSCVICR